mmetsp:Transcript_49560/g.49934  ORF Transcript_49560/g.49934 Transcript_49560/m.49934 type:complete len:287 (+) Transcript_49560:532-1392(+)
MPQLVLRNGRGPQFRPDYLGWRSVRFQQHLTTSLVHFGNDFILGQVGNAHILRSTDIIQKEIVPFWGPPGEEGATPQCSQCPHTFTARIQAPESRQVLQIAKAVAEFHVLECRFGISHRHGVDRRVVDAAALRVGDGAHPREDVGGFRKDGFQRCGKRVGRGRGDDRFGGYGLNAVGCFVCSQIVAVAGAMFQIDEFPVEPQAGVFVEVSTHGLTQPLANSVGKRLQPFPETAGVTVLELGPRRIGRVGFALLGELHLPRQSAVEDGTALVPLNVVTVGFDARNFG